MGALFHSNATTIADSSSISCLDHCDPFLIRFSDLIPRSCHHLCCPLLPGSYSPDTSCHLSPASALLPQLICAAVWRPSTSTTSSTTSPAPIDAFPTPRHPHQGRATSPTSERTEEAFPCLPDSATGSTSTSYIYPSFIPSSQLRLNVLVHSSRFPRQHR